MSRVGQQPSMLCGCVAVCCDTYIANPYTSPSSAGARDRGSTLYPPPSFSTPYSNFGECPTWMMDSGTSLATTHTTHLAAVGAHPHPNPHHTGTGAASHLDNGLWHLVGHHPDLAAIGAHHHCVSRIQRVERAEGACVALCKLRELQGVPGRRWGQGRGSEGRGWVGSEGQ